MSLALDQRHITRNKRRWALPWVAAAVCLSLLAAHLTYDFLLGRKRLSMVNEALAAAASLQQPQPHSATASNPKTTVALGAAKLKAAKIATAPTRFDELPTELSVPGRIEFNADRRIEIRPQATGVVRQVHVVQGQNVKKGDLLVTLDSPEIGTARLNLRARQRELVTARIEAEWKSQVAAAVALLIPEIRKGTDPSAIEKEFGDKPLGSYRGTLLQAYAEFDIAAHEEEKTALLRREEVQGEHPAVVAKHTREGLQAKLYGTIEQVKFDASHEKRLADQRLRRSESDVIDAAQRLRILGVSENIRELLDHADRANDLAMDEDVTIYQIKCPFDGTVIKKDVVRSQRAEPTDVLFTVADLKNVWVTANIAESDVDKVPKIEGGSIRLTATTYGARVFPAKLLSVGAMVDPLTRTVPLLAQTDNPEGLLKLGMFVRILLDSPTTERALTVPHSAVVEIEGKNGVFVPASTEGAPASDQRTFTFKPIEIGRELGDRVVVRSGLKESEIVVAAGAYQLKSELVLQNTAEED
jgi:multidrug efflux pump subunit AcrA (membrane-fusion protein)